MTTASYRSYSGTAAELYQSFFVPTIATPVSRELLEAARLQPGERVLDLACGTGIITRAAAERVGTTGAVTGIDVAPDMIATAKETPAAGAPIEWHEADAVDLPVPDGCYDVALCQMGLMFMPDKPAALAELRRVLTPGGRVVVNTPGRIQPAFEAMEQAIVDNLSADLGAFVSAVFSMHDPGHIAELLRDAGFEGVDAREYTAPLTLPGPAEFLWNYINLTPMGALIADAPQSAKDALEHQVVDSWAPFVDAGTTPVDQPMVLGTGRA
jgi:ubiquinone/menaquinone biosynthesis C-methylase UbiE